MKSTNWTRLIKAGSISWKGQEDFGILEMAEGIILSEGKVTESDLAGTVTKRISGDLRLLDYEDVEAGGFLDAEIIPDPDDPERIYLGTLIKDAYLNIGKNFRLQGGTIRFEYCSNPHAPGKPLPYQIDETDELLFQSTDPLPLGAMHITGVGNTPITLSVSLNALNPEKVRAYISLFPACIAVPVFGKTTIVFLTGEHKDNVVEMDLKNEWSNVLSSSPHLTLISPLDPNGNALVTGAFFLIGLLECRGMCKARMSLSSYLNYATAFPQSTWPQELPYQKIMFSISEIGDFQLKIAFNPLAIDGFLIYDAEGKNKPLVGSLCDTGFSFKGNFLVALESPDDPPRVLPAFVVDNHCRIWVVSGNKKIELRDWLV